MRRMLGTAMVALIGCAAPGINLTPSAQRVIVTNVLPTDGQYEMVGELSASHGQNFRTLDTNIDLCRADLKAGADQLGAQVVVLTTQTAGPASCANCASMRANAYRRK